MTHLRAITFDFWNTLVVEDGEQLARLRRAALLGILDETGIEVEDAELDRRLAAAGALHNVAWREGLRFTPREAAEHLADSLGSAAQARRTEIVAAYLEAGSEAKLQPAPQALEAVADLSDSGLTLGIVCDVGLTGSLYLRRHLEKLGILQHFSAWAFSDEVGAFKPSPRIFRHALAGMGMQASAEIAHVGDLKRTDVRGARDAGLLSIRYRGVFDDVSDSAEADFVIDDLLALRDFMTDGWCRSGP
jgi:putative hydrolase of the HAD superfamily